MIESYLRHRVFTNPPEQRVSCTFFAQADIVGWLGTIGAINMSISLTERYASIWGFEVQDEYQNMGHGSKLLTACIEMARQCDCQYVNLTVFKVNKDAVRLYERFGFEKSGDHGGAWEMTLYL